MTDFAARITDILRGHSWSTIRHQCRCDDPGTISEWPAHLAPLIAAAAEQHYRPPITTVERLSMLPTGTIIRSQTEGMAERFSTGRWYVAGSRDHFCVQRLREMLPAVVLWSPGADDE